MSIERYKMLTTSYMRIKHTSKVRIIVFICLSWLLPLLSWIPLIIVYRVSYGPNDVGDCMVPANKYLVLGLCVMLYHIPLLFMVVFYSKLIIHIKKSSLTNYVDDKTTKNKRSNFPKDKNKLFVQPLSKSSSRCEEKNSLAVKTNNSTHMADEKSRNNVIRPIQDLNETNHGIFSRNNSTSGLRKNVNSNAKTKQVKSLPTKPSHNQHQASTFINRLQTKLKHLNHHKNEFVLSVSNGSVKSHRQKSVDHNDDLIKR
jgi:hypothetical protein